MQITSDQYSSGPKAGLELQVELLWQLQEQLVLPTVCASRSQPCRLKFAICRMRPLPFVPKPVEDCEHMGLVVNYAKVADVLCNAWLADIPNIQTSATATMPLEHRHYVSTGMVACTGPRRRGLQEGRGQAGACHGCGSQFWVLQPICCCHGLQVCIRSFSCCIKPI